MIRVQVWNYYLINPKIVCGEPSFLGQLFYGDRGVLGQKYMFGLY